MAVLPDGGVAVADARPRGLLVFADDGVYAARNTMIGPEAGGGLSAMPSEVPILRVGIDGEAEPEVLHRAWIPPRPDPQVSEGRARCRAR